MALRYVIKKRTFGFDKTKAEKYVAQNVITNTLDFRDLCEEITKVGPARPLWLIRDNFLLCLGIKATLHIIHIYRLFTCQRNPSLCIPPCFIVDHAHFRLSGCLRIGGIHRPPIIGISRHHLPVFIVKLYVIAVA